MDKDEMLETLQLITIAALYFYRARSLLSRFACYSIRQWPFKFPDSAFEAFTFIYENESLAMP